MWCGSYYGVGGWISIRLYTCSCIRAPAIILLFAPLSSLHCPRTRIHTNMLLVLTSMSTFPPPSVFFPSSVLLSPLPYLSLTPSLFHSSFISPLLPYLSASVSPHIIHRNGTRSGQTSSTHFLRLKSPVFAGWRDSSTCGCVGVSNTHTCYTHMLYTHCSLFTVSWEQFVWLLLMVTIRVCLSNH